MRVQCGQAVIQGGAASSQLVHAVVQILMLVDKWWLL